MTCNTNKNTENDFCTSRLTWTDLQIVQSVVHVVQLSCTIKNLSRERGSRNAFSVFKVSLIFFSKEWSGRSPLPVIFHYFFLAQQQNFFVFVDPEEAIGNLVSQVPPAGG